METRTINVYKFSELSATAKDRARIDAQSDGFDREYEYMASIKALAAHFGGSIKTYSLDWSNSSGPSSMTFDMPDMDEAEIRRKLAALGSFNPKTLHGNGDCKLTGVCYDECAIDGFRIAFVREGKRDLNALMQAAFDSWIKAAWEEYRYDFGDEGMSEMADANDLYYYGDGRVFRS